MTRANHDNAPSYGTDEWDAARGRSPARAFRERQRRGLLRLQRHRGQLARARRVLPVLPQRHLPRARAHHRGRVRRARILLQRHQAPRRAGRARQARAAGHHRARLQAQRHPLPQAARDQPHAVNRAGRRLLRRRAAGHPRGSRAGTTWRCRWTAHASPTQPPRSASRRSSPPGRRASTCSASAAASSAWPAVKRLIFFNRQLAQEFDYRCKQAGQLASKMRFLASGWVGILEGGAWLKHAQHANRCAPAARRAFREGGRPARRASGRGQRRVHPDARAALPRAEATRLGHL